MFDSLDGLPLDTISHTEDGGYCSDDERHETTLSNEQEDTYANDCCVEDTLEDELSLIEMQPINLEAPILPEDKTSEDAATRKRNKLYYQQLLPLLVESLRRQDAIDPLLRSVNFTPKIPTAPSNRGKRSRSVKDDLGSTAASRKRTKLDQQYDLQGNALPSTRAPRTVFKRYVQRRRNYEAKWFRNHVHGTAKRIFKGTTTMPPFRIVVLDISAEEWLQQCTSNKTEQSPEFENGNHKKLILMEGPTIVVDKHLYPLIIDVEETDWYASSRNDMVTAVESLPREDSGGAPTRNDFRNKRREKKAKQWVFTYVFEQAHVERGPLIGADCIKTSQQKKEFVSKLVMLMLTNH